jgi:drug/metabolite transporter (DMT)-like permease
MLQRIQTVWLLIASTLGFATLSNSISFYSGNKLIENISKFVPLNARENIFILILTVSIAVATLVAIFLYKDRKMQLKIALGILAVSLANIGLYYLQTKNYIEGKMDLTSLVVFAIPVFLLLAARGIWKDEQLVKSVDRLR